MKIEVSAGRITSDLSLSLEHELYLAVLMKINGEYLLCGGNYRQDPRFAAHDIMVRRFCEDNGFVADEIVKKTVITKAHNTSHSLEVLGGGRVQIDSFITKQDIISHGRPHSDSYGPVKAKNDRRRIHLCLKRLAGQTPGLENHLVLDDWYNE